MQKCYERKQENAMALVSWRFLELVMRTQFLHIQIRNSKFPSWLNLRWDSENIRVAHWIPTEVIKCLRTHSQFSAMHAKTYHSSFKIHFNRFDFLIAVAVMSWTQILLCLLLYWEFKILKVLERFQLCNIFFSIQQIFCRIWTRFSNNAVNLRPNRQKFRVY